MTVIVVINGELAADSQLLNTPKTGLGITLPIYGQKTFKSACGRAVGAKTGSEATQANFERTFAYYETAIINWESVQKLKDDPKYPLPGFMELEFLPEAKPELRELMFGFVIMTKLSVLTVSRLGALIHPNDSPTWIAQTGADSHVTSTLTQLGYDARTVVEKHRQYSPYSGGDIHVYQASKLKPMVVKAPAVKKPRRGTQK